MGYTGLSPQEARYRALCEAIVEWAMHASPSIGGANGPAIDRACSYVARIHWATLRKRWPRTALHIARGLMQRDVCREIDYRASMAQGDDQ